MHKNFEEDNYEDNLKRILCITNKINYIIEQKISKS